MVSVRYGDDTFAGFAVMARRGSGESTPPISRLNRKPPPGWDGLHFEAVDVAAGPLRLQVSASGSLLVLHEDAGRICSVRCDDTSARFIVAARRFDFVPASANGSFFSEGPSARLFVIHVPLGFENAVLAEGQRQTGASARFQFVDRRLERLVGMLARLAGHSSSTADVVVLSVAVVDRIQETCGLQSPDRGEPGLSPVIRNLVIDYIDQHMSMSVDGEHLAALTGISRSQFAVLFRNTLGTSVHQYVLARKIDVAVRRLQEGVPVGELAYDLGFSSHSHFSTVFRQHVGVSPRDFQRGDKSDA